MTLNWPGKYTGCLLIIVIWVFFFISFSQALVLLRDAHSQRLRTARHNQTTTEPDLTITRHVIRMTEDSRPCSVRFKSKAGAVNKRIVTKYSGTCSFFSQPIHTACCLPPPHPSTSHHHLVFGLFQSVVACPLALLTSQQEGESQTRILVS